MHFSQHITPWVSWLGSGTALYGLITGEKLQVYLGVATAIGFSLIGTYGYLRQVWDSWELKREAAKAAFRRQEAVLDEQLRLDLEKLHQTQGQPTP